MKTTARSFWKTLAHGAAFGAALTTSVLTLSYAYAAFSSLTAVNTGDTLSKTAWNTMVSNLDDLNARSVPTGAVMAFNSTSCPVGWSLFSSANGRTIIGIGNDGQGNTYALSNSGGEAKHVLATTEMPSHWHAFSWQVDVGQGGSLPNNYVVISWAGWQYYPTANQSVWNSVANAGWGQSHENRMPYVALLYCVKN